jgi:hypothetical protein
MLWVEPLDSVLISVRGRIGMQVCVLTVLRTTYGIHATPHENRIYSKMV